MLCCEWIVMFTNWGPSFWTWSHRTTKPWRAIRDKIIPGLQRNRHQTDQAYCRWVEVFSIHGKALHTLEICCLSCVSSACTLDTQRLSPPYCRATPCVERHNTSMWRAVHTQTHTHTHIHTHTDRHTDRQTHTHTQTHIHTHTQTQTHTHRQTHRHTDTHTRLVL